MDANDRRLRASEEAAEWWTRLQGDDVPRAEREQFVDWLRESPAHVAEMLRIAQVHGALEWFERWADLATVEVDLDAEVVELPRIASRSTAPPSEPRLAQRRVFLAFAVAAAAAAAGVALLLPVFFGQVIETERGERREVVLAEGSVLQVDPETRLRVKLTEDARQVRLERGRALFRVAKDPARPFTVRAGDAIVRAVGTAFGVERWHRGVVVTVAEGRVAVQGREPPRGAVPAVPVMLDADQQVTVANAGSPEPVRRVDSRRELAWAQGRLVFENDDIATVVAEFNRYNYVQLEVADPALARRTISGVFDASDPESFIAFVQNVTPVQIVREPGEGIIIAPAEAH